MGTPFTSARNGLWDASDVDTWGQGLGVYPQTAADVVNMGHTVTYNKVSTVELGQITINNSGILTFSTTMSTKLTLGHQDIQINSGGELRVGASGTVIPVIYTAELVWHTTADATKGINVANGGKLTIYGDPTFYGSKYNYLLAAQVVIPSSGSVTVTVTGNYAANFTAGQELVIHKGGAYASCTNDFARLAVVSAANNGANTDISCTVTERPAALTCLVGADVLNLSRNVNLYLLGYNPGIGQVNANRPRLGNASANNANNINVYDAAFGGWNKIFQSNSNKVVRVVVRNGNQPVYFAYNSDIEIVCFSSTAPINTLVNSTLKGKIISGIATYAGLYNCHNIICYADIYGSSYGCSGLLGGRIYGNVYANQYGYCGCLDTIVNGAIGFDASGNSKANTYDFEFANSFGGFHCDSKTTCINAKTNSPPTFNDRNLFQDHGRVCFEHYLQQANSHYVFDVFGDLVKVLADGSGTLPSQRSGGSQFVEQVTPQSNCGGSVPCAPGLNNYLEIFNVRVWGAAGVTKTYTFYVQNNFGKTLTDAMLALYADYLDNNPVGSGHPHTVQSSGVSIANRANQADWSQSISVTVTPQADGWVNLYLRLMDGTNASLWVDPMMVVS